MSLYWTWWLYKTRVEGCQLICLHQYPYLTVTVSWLAINYFWMKDWVNYVYWHFRSALLFLWLCYIYYLYFYMKHLITVSPQCLYNTWMKIWLEYMESKTIWSLTKYISITAGNIFFFTVLIFRIYLGLELFASISLAFPMKENDFSTIHTDKWRDVLSFSYKTLQSK